MPSPQKGPERTDRARWKTSRRRGRWEGQSLDLRKSSRALCQRQDSLALGTGSVMSRVLGPAESPDASVLEMRAQVRWDSVLDTLWGELRPWRRDCSPGRTSC